MDLELDSLIGGTGITLTDTVDDLTLSIDATVLTTSSNLEDLNNVTATGCTTNQILKVIGTTWECTSDIGDTDVQFSYLIKQSGTAHKVYTIIDSTGATVATSNGDLTAAWDTMDTDATSLPGVIYQFGVGDFYVNTTLTTEHDNIIIRGFGAGATIIHAADDLPTDTSIFTLNEDNNGATEYQVTGLQDTRNPSFVTETVGDATNFSAGDRIIIISDKCIDIGTCGRTQGEIHEVETDGNGATGVVEIRGNTWTSFHDVDNPRAIVIPNFIDNITFDGFSLVNDFTALQDVGYSSAMGIKIRQADNITIKNISFKDMYRATFHCVACTKLLFTNNDIDVVRLGFGGFNYGISAFGGSNHLIQANHFKFFRHIYTNGALNNPSDETENGGIFNIVIDGNTSIESTGGHISLHEASPYAVISNNVMHGQDVANNGIYCIETRSNFTSIVGNTCSGVHTGIALAEQAYGTVISGNTIANVKAGIGLDHNVTNSLIIGNYIQYDKANGILLSDAGDNLLPHAGDDTLIIGNYIVGNGSGVGQGIEINSQRDVTIMSNVFKNMPTAITILDTDRAGHLDDIVIINNVFDDVTTPISNSGDDFDVHQEGNVGSGVINEDANPMVRIKTSDQIIQNDGARSLDGSLRFNAEPNTYYLIEGKAFFNSTTNAHFEYDFQCTGCTGKKITFEWSGAAESTIGNFDAGIVVTLASSGDFVVSFSGWIKQDATEDAAGFAWAQGTSHGDKTTLLEGSYMKVYKVS